MPFKDKAVQNAYQLRRLKERRLAWVKANGPCRACGSRDDLEVDHIDPTTKVDHKVWGWSAARRAAELAKCQVLCNDCHLKKTVKQLSTPIIHGLISSYLRRKCRCLVCTVAHAQHCRDWKERTGYRSKKV